MKLKQFTLYNLKYNLKNLGMFYAIYTAILVALGVLAAVLTRGGANIHINGNSFAAGIYLFVMGIVLFGQNLRIGLGNGVSRRTMALGSALTVLAIALVAALGGVFLAQVWSWVLGSEITTLQLVYGGYFASHGGAVNFLARVAYDFGINLAWFAAGYFIGGGYYRMNKLAKILVSIFVPAFLVIGLPILVPMLPSGVLHVLADAFVWLIGFIERTPFHLALCLALASAVLGLFAWLLARRAPLKLAN